MPSSDDGSLENLNSDEDEDDIRIKKYKVFTENEGSMAARTASVAEPKSEEAYTAKQDQFEEDSESEMDEEQSAKAEKEEDPEGDESSSDSDNAEPTESATPGNNTSSKENSFPSSLKKRLARRYFEEEDSSITCRHCGGIGHLARNCVNEKLPKPCFLCGFKGHTSRDCPNQMCHRCRLPGHRIAQCNNKAWPEDTCYRCLERGHMPYDCPFSVCPKGAPSAPPPRPWVSPLLAEAWGGQNGRKDYWQAVATLKSRLGTGGKAAKGKSKLKGLKSAGKHTVFGEGLEGDESDEINAGQARRRATAQPNQDIKVNKKRLRDADDFQRELALKPSFGKAEDEQYEGRRKRQKMRVLEGQDGGGRGAQDFGRNVGRVTITLGNNAGNSSGNSSGNNSGNHRGGKHQTKYTGGAMGKGNVGWNAGQKKGGKVGKFGKRF